MDRIHPTFVSLDDDILLIIVEYLYYTSRHTLASLACACKSIHNLVRSNLFRSIRVDLSREWLLTTRVRLQYFEHHGLLSSIQTLEVLNARDNDEYPLIQSFVGPSDECADDRYLDCIWLLSARLRDMTRLRDLTWPNGCVPRPVLEALGKHQSLRLHTVVDSQLNPSQRRDFWPDHLFRLQYRDNLSSLTVRARHECMQIMPPLKLLLLTCPNLRSLTLDILQSTSRSTPTDLIPRYHAFGFVNGEAPPPLEQLVIYNYPFGEGKPFWTTSPEDTYLDRIQSEYPGAGREVDYWARYFDWSRLKRLQTHRLDLADALVPYLTALKHVALTYPPSDKDMAAAIPRLLAGVPSLLESISIPNLHQAACDVGWPHGKTLRKLRLHQNEGNVRDWREAALDAKALRNLRRHCPFVEDLEVDLLRDDDWPFEALDTLASFPCLETLTIWFELGHARRCCRERAKPPLTFSAAAVLFAYLREQRCSHKERSRLQRLEIHSGNMEIKEPGHVARQVSSAYWQSTYFICTLSEREDEAANGEFTTTCPILSKSENDYLVKYAGQANAPGISCMSTELKIAQNGPFKADGPCLYASDH